ncbi:3-oxoacyl-[acyl-carrier-protein] reductase [Peptoniphilus sp. ING2-D1G]|nr:3-oxoacyl-[acyl-carrier-protein] reductase [Peptoniphilus sp. ING2-D1G]
MDYGLKDKVGIVLAAGGGLGSAVAMELAKEGAKVVLSDYSEDNVKEKVKWIKDETGNNNVDYIAGDMTDPQFIKDIAKYTLDTFGPCYALFNNAGGPPAGPILSFDDEAWYKAFDLTLLSYVRMMREVVPMMREEGGGRIVNSTSSSIKSFLFNLGLSNTMRSGVVGLSKTVSQEEGSHGILCNVIGPGRIGTARIDYLDKMRADKAGKTVEQIQQETYATIPLGRYGKPEEYGRLAAFLLAPSNTYITGQAILLDGGLVKAL